jgi:hypothetical protein
MEFLSPSTLRPRRVHSTPACLTGYVPSTGFLTLSTACSSPERPALFHAGNAHGVFALQGLSLTARFRGSSPRNCPLDVSPRINLFVDAWHPSPHAETRFSGLFRLQGLAPTANPYHRRTVTPCAMADPLLSFGASPGSCPRSQATLRVTCATLALSLPWVFCVRSRASPRSSAEVLVRPKASQRSSSNSVFVRPRASPRSSSDGVVVQSRDKPAIVLRQGRLRSSGFARKRGISLRGAKYPLLRFAAFLLQSLLERRPTQCPSGQLTRSAFRHTYDVSPRAS